MYFVWNPVYIGVLRPLWLIYFRTVQYDGYPFTA